MAIAVPLIMGAMGAGTAAIAITTVAFAVTGISAKINKAAASVFGEDLVQIGNLFGAAYGAFSGAFSGGASAADGLAGAGIDQAATAGDYVNSMDMASDAVTNSGNFGSLAQMADAGNVANAVDYGSDIANQADGITQMGGDAADFTGAAKAQPSNVIDAIGQQPSPMETANSTGQPQNILPTNGAVSSQAAGQQAAAPGAAGAQSNAAGTGAARNVTAPPSSVNPPPAQPRSFFDKLIFDDKGGINPSTLRIGGQVLAGYGKSKAEQELFDRRMAEERRRASQGVGFRVTN